MREDLADHFCSSTDSDRRHRKTFRIKLRTRSAALPDMCLTSIELCRASIKSLAMKAWQMQISLVREASARRIPNHWTRCLTIGMDYFLRFFFSYRAYLGLFLGNATQNSQRQVILRHHVSANFTLASLHHSECHLLCTALSRFQQENHRPDALASNVRGHRNGAVAFLLAHQSGFVVFLHMIKPPPPRRSFNPRRDDCRAAQDASNATSRLLPFYCAIRPLSADRPLSFRGKHGVNHPNSRYHHQSQNRRCQRPSFTDAMR